MTSASSLNATILDTLTESRMLHFSFRRLWVTAFTLYLLSCQVWSRPQSYPLKRRLAQAGSELHARTAQTQPGSNPSQIDDALSCDNSQGLATCGYPGKNLMLSESSPCTTNMLRRSGAVLRDRHANLLLGQRPVY